MLGNISVHPTALAAYDTGELEKDVNVHLDSLEEELSKTLRAQYNAGLITGKLRLREYVGCLTGLVDEIAVHLDQEVRGTDQTWQNQRKLRDLEKRLDDYVSNAAKRIDILSTSANLSTHVRIIFGFDDELANLAGNSSENISRRAEIEAEIKGLVERSMQIPFVQQSLEEIRSLRAEVAMRNGMDKEIEAVRDIPVKIKNLIRSRGYRSGKEHYVQTLAQGLALFCMAFYGRDIIYRTTDFKSNEYRNLLGGVLYEQHEDNPMLGWRGVSRNLDDWELEAFKLARDVYGGKNLHLMLPFVRTLEEARSMRRYLEQIHKLKSGADGLKIIQMSEIPSNAILSKEFIAEFDGFSLGSNDMTQMVLATDRDNASLQHIYDEEDPAVVWAILTTVFTGLRLGKKVGFCGQGVSNSLIIRGLVAIAGISSASVVPDTYFQTKLDVHAIEKQNIPCSSLGAWLKEQHLAKMKKLMEKEGYGHILKKYTLAAELMEWYEGESRHLQENLRENLTTSKETFYRQEMERFRTVFHKQAIYADWNWDQTVLDAFRAA
jgi:pyruvate,water dikinase